MSGNAKPERMHNSTGLGQFFRYHGWLAPGIRLFRQLGFPAKAALMCAAFVVPLLVLLAMHWSETRSLVAFAQAERDGLRVVRPLLAVVHAAQNRRRAAAAKAADLPQAQDKVREAFDVLQSGSSTTVAALELNDTLEALRRSHQALLDKPVAGTPDDTFRIHSDFIDAALDMVREVANASQLVLDPELDTYHMMSMSVLRAPTMQENTGRLRGLGNLVLREGKLTPERRELLVRWDAIWDFLDREVEDAYREGIVKFPDAAARFDMKGTDAASEAFQKAVRTQILGESLSGDAKTFLALGNAAVNKQTELADAVRERLDEQLRYRIDSLNTALAVKMVASTTCVLLAAYLMLSFYRVMLGGLHEVSSHLKAITHGNLTTVPRPWGRDEAADLMLDLGAMQRALRQVVSTVLDGSSQVRTASHEISTATNDLSRRSEQAAANLQQTAARTDEISSTVRQTTHTVQSAKEIVNTNAEAAQRGGQVIENVVATMEGIRTASGRIGEIIGVIDGIAFQTNILALNAAVEAARAGEQGRGFAVVAGEVRALASRSAGAAREIKDLIQDSLHQVEAGAQVVAEAGQTMTTIVENAHKITGLMNQIDNATQEQSVSVEQVGSVVQELDRSTQQNAALVEQTAAATQALSDQATRLAQEVGFFKIPATP